MRCPHCGSADSKVTDSRAVENGVRRRRECEECHARFTTYERIHTTALMVTKHDNRREEFDANKLASGIRKACAKRPVAARAVEKMVEEIETELHHLGQAEVRTDTLGRMVMDRLKLLDRVAYIRFASVYRDFQDIDSFEKASKTFAMTVPSCPCSMMSLLWLKPVAAGADHPSSATAPRTAMTRRMKTNPLKLRMYHKEIC